MSDLVPEALRLGWLVAEVRGRTWRPRPEPTEPPLPDRPLGVLPLRSQRDFATSRQEAVGSLLRLVDQLGVQDVDEPLRLVTPEPAGPWSERAAGFTALDGAIQDQLTRTAEHQATAYLLGRGLAECYWSFGDPATDGHGAGLEYLFSDERVRELTRMLGRLKAEPVAGVTPSAIAGSLGAWHAVAVEQPLAAGEEVEVPLREQVRRWYQLLVIGQDPTTMVTPGRRLGRRHYWLKAMRDFWPQIALAVLALLLTSAFFVPTDSSLGELLEDVRPLLATFGVGALAAAGLMTRAQNLAQQVLTRLHQDTYADLVAVSVAQVPEWLPREQLEAAVRARGLTQSTPPR